MQSPPQEICLLLCPPLWPSLCPSPLSLAHLSVILVLYHFFLWAWYGSGGQRQLFIVLLDQLAVTQREGRKGQPGTASFKRNAPHPLPSSACSGRFYTFFQFCLKQLWRTKIHSERPSIFYEINVHTGIKQTSYWSLHLLLPWRTEANMVYHPKNYLCQ